MLTCGGRVQVRSLTCQNSLVIEPCYPMTNGKRQIAIASLAIVTLGGLLTSTFLNLIVVPAGYSLVFGHKPERRPADHPSVLTRLVGIFRRPKTITSKES